MSDAVRILVGDVMDGLKSLGDGSVHCVVTSPPYWGLRDYGVDGQIGLEATPEAFIAKMVEVFGEVRRVLREDGTLWLNIGDSYAGSGKGGYAGGASTLQGSTDGPDGSRIAKERMKSRRRDDADMPRPLSDVGVPGMKPKDLMMMPWRVALALQADGWWIRSAIVWAKKSPMPESCRDRPTSSWEPIFLLAKSERYFYDAEAVKEPMESNRPDMAQKGVRTGLAYLSQDVVPSNHLMPPIGGVKHAGSNGNATYSGDRPEWPSGRNQRNVWHLGPEPYAEAHFATFPTEIPRRAIKAGTSEKGCCPACGTPWRRVLSKSKITRERPNDFTKRDGADGTGNHCANSVAGVESRTLGWQPGCSCNAGEPVPCVVLDPFLGSGTTIAVARQLGRWGVGCELNPEYAELARIRIGKAEKPLTFQDPRVKGDAPLFAGGLNA